MTFEEDINGPKSPKLTKILRNNGEQNEDDLKKLRITGCDCVLTEGTCCKKCELQFMDSLTLEVDEKNTFEVANNFDCESKQETVEESSSSSDIAKFILDEICDNAFNQILSFCDKSIKPDEAPEEDLIDFTEITTNCDVNNEPSVITISSESDQDDNLSDCDCEDCLREQGKESVLKENLVDEDSKTKKSKRNSLEVEKRVSFCIDEGNQSTPKKYTSKSLPDLVYCCGNEEKFPRLNQTQQNEDVFSKNFNCDTNKYFLTAETVKSDDQSSVDSTIEDVDKFRECINKQVSNYINESIIEENELVAEENNNNFLANKIKVLHRKSHVYDDTLSLASNYSDSCRLRDSLYSVNEYEEDDKNTFDAVNDSLVDCYSDEDSYSVIDENVILEEGGYEDYLEDGESSLENDEENCQEDTSQIKGNTDSKDIKHTEEKTDTKKKDKKRRSFFGSFLSSKKPQKDSEKASKDSVKIRDKSRKDNDVKSSDVKIRKDKDTKARKDKESKGRKDKDAKNQANKSLVKSRKYSSSAIDVSVSEKSSLSRTPSFIKKLSRLSSDASQKLKRSFSYRDVNKGQENKDHLSAKTLDKNAEWAKSLQNLIETDTSVSYNDLSFINYDALNTVTYNPIKKNLHRTQGLNVKGSQDGRNGNFSRGASIPHDYQSTSSLSIDSGAISLPSLHHLAQENADTATASAAATAETSPKHRYRRRPQSINSEDGRLRQCASGSFRSAGSGCAKLKRHNACRQKSREVSLSTEGLQRTSDQATVRSRSLNHLDHLEMRQGLPVPTEGPLKDARSEPDCSQAQPLLAPPGAGPTPTPEPPSPSSEVPNARRHMLSRSQKSSSECFSVNFEVGDESTWENTLFFPAARGVTLADSLSKLCELRNIDLASCDIWLFEEKDCLLSTLLSVNHDTAVLVGKQLKVTQKGRRPVTGVINHSRKLSENFRPRTSSNFFSSSTEDPTSTSNLSVQDLDSSKKSTNKRWTGFWGKQDPQQSTRMEPLVEQLNAYSKQNFTEKSKHYPQGQCESVDALYNLENDWREIVITSELSDKQQQQQAALWELIKTEAAYIKTLKVVTDLFLACLKSLQQNNLLREIDNDKLFSNIVEILDANVMFWRNWLFPIVKDMRKHRQPACLERMLEGFQKIKENFNPYFTFCGDQSRCQHYCREKNRTNTSFTAYLAWCETQKECNRLKLLDILVQPMQRLTKYGLLLKAILRHTDDEDEVNCLNNMIKAVDEFVNEVNHSLKHKQENERLNGIIARIESYDVVESKDDDLERLLRNYSHLDLTKPMIGCHPDRKRHLLLEGDLKLKDANSSSKMEVHCFLLTDMLLICKPSTKRGAATLKVIRQPYLVDNLVVTELNRETPSLAVVYRNPINVATAGFILQNTDAKKLKAWKDNIAKAQALYMEAKQSSIFMTEESVDTDIDYNFDSLPMPPRSPMASSSRASRVSSLAHSHSGSVEMNDQSSIGSAKEPSRAVSMENENRTASISSDEGVQPLPPDRSPVSQKNSFKHRLFNKTPNTLSVQPYGNLGQSLPNLTLGSPNVGTLSLSLNQNTLSVPNAKNGGHLLSPTHRGISYPPPSPTRGNLRRGLAITQSKNPPLIKTRHITSTTNASASAINAPTSFDFDVPVIAGVSSPEECENFSRGHHRQAMCKRIRNDNKRYHTAGVVDDIKRHDNRDSSIHKRLSWNYSAPAPQSQPDDQT